MRLVFLVMGAALLLSACGGSKSASSPAASSSTTSMATSSTSATSTRTESSRHASSAGSRSATSGGGGSSRGGSSGGGSSRGESSGGGSSGRVAATPRIPATYKIESGDRLDPPTVSAPAHLAVQLTLVSADGKGHHAVLRTVTAYPLTVPANGRATVLIPGQRAGHYALDVDGRPRGALVIGVQPGP